MTPRSTRRRRAAGRPDEEWDADRGLERQHLAVEAVIAEELAVIGRDDDPGVLVEARVRERREDAADAPIDERDLAEVGAARAGDVVGGPSPLGAAVALLHRGDGTCAGAADRRGEAGASRIGQVLGGGIERRMRSGKADLQVERTIAGRGAHDVGGATGAEAVEVVLGVEVPRRGVGRIAGGPVVRDEVLPPDVLVGSPGGVVAVSQSEWALRSWWSCASGSSTMSR